MRSTRFSLLLCLLGCGLLAPAGAAAGGPTEPFFPRAGNRGYDALHYGVNLAYNPSSGRIRVKERLAARATEDLRWFSLDLYGLQVESVKVGRDLAEFRRGRGKLKVRSPWRIEAGQRFTVVIRYRGRPRPVVDPDGTREGWQQTDDGALAVGEPVGTPSWLACNNLPSDKAAFSINLSVPEHLKAVANGRLEGAEPREGGLRTFGWREVSPMSPYLAVISIGPGRLVKQTIGGHLFWTLIDPRLAQGGRRVLRELPEVIDFQSRLFGDYPFEGAGSILDYAPRLGYALETQSRPIYTYVPSRTLIVHETAHQWFGDSVGLKRWPEIWLNEGFATWTQWYYAETHGGRSAQEVLNRLYRIPASDRELWQPPPGRPGTPRHLFDPTIYVRGAMALQALREEIGTEPMLEVLRRWVEEHRHDSADIRQFIALAESVSGKQLDPLFQRWLYQRGKPR